MPTYERIKDLSFEIQSYELEPLKEVVSSGTTRHTTVIAFGGKGERGAGEDVTYDDIDQLAFQEYGQKLDFSGTYTIDSFSKKLTSEKLFPSPPQQDAYYYYRQWAYESAGLSLALKQAGTTLAKILGLSLCPLRFVVSTRLGEPSSLEPVKKLLESYSGLRFKLDPTNDWTDGLITELAELNVVETIDLKGHYRDTPVDVQTDPELYRKLLEAFPKAWIEDPDVTDTTEAVLHTCADRISWDAPIHSVDDIKSMPFPVRGINVKPSRFGSLKNLFEAYDYCKQNRITMYGGGQYELGPGRQQIQYLASLFHPDAPNDVAPREYNTSKVPPGLSESPMKVKEEF